MADSSSDTSSSGYDPDPDDIQRSIDINDGIRHPASVHGLIERMIKMSISPAPKHTSTPNDHIEFLKYVVKTYDGNGKGKVRNDQKPILGKLGTYKLELEQAINIGKSATALKLLNAIERFEHGLELLNNNGNPVDIIHEFSLAIQGEEELLELPNDQTKMMLVQVVVALKKYLTTAQIGTTDVETIALDIAICCCFLDLSDKLVSISYVKECTEVYPMVKSFHILFSNSCDKLNMHQHGAADGRISMELFPKDEDIMARFVLHLASLELGRPDRQNLIKAFNEYLDIASEGHRFKALAFYYIAWLYLDLYKDSIHRDGISDARKGICAKTWLPKVRQFYLTGIDADKAQITCFRKYSWAKKAELDKFINSPDNNVHYAKLGIHPLKVIPVEPKKFPQQISQREESDNLSNSNRHKIIIAHRKFVQQLMNTRNTRKAVGLGVSAQTVEEKEIHELNLEQVQVRGLSADVVVKETVSQEFTFPQLQKMAKERVKIWNASQLQPQPPSDLKERIHKFQEVDYEAFQKIVLIQKKFSNTKFRSTGTPKKSEPVLTLGKINSVIPLEAKLPDNLMKVVTFKDIIKDGSCVTTSNNNILVTVKSIEDAIEVDGCLHLLLEDKNKDVVRAFIYKYPETDLVAIQSKYGFGSKFLIANPTMIKVGTDGCRLRAEYVDNYSITPGRPSQPMMCRFCLTEKMDCVLQCKECLKSFYCSRRCQEKDWNTLKHKTICFTLTCFKFETGQ